MKYFYQMAAVISLAALFFSCKPKNEIEVNFVGEVSSRRTFASIQSITDEKERELYIAKQEASNPTLSFTTDDSLLIKRFEKIGLVKNNEFIQSAFKSQTNQRTTFTDNRQGVYKFEFFTDSLSHTVHFRISSSNSSIDVDTKTDPLQNLDYVFLDIIPGGNRELIFLDDYYVMNGFNFNLKVYEITTW